MQLKPIVANRITIGAGEFPATDEEAKTVELAMVCFGFLLKQTTDVTRYSFAQFADAIEACYDSKEPTAEKVGVLRAIHNRIALRADGIANYCEQVCGGGQCGSGPVCLYGINPETQLPGVAT